VVEEEESPVVLEETEILQSLHHLKETMEAHQPALEILVLVAVVAHLLLVKQGLLPKVEMAVLERRPPSPELL
jgi:hypothetical protein